MLWIITTVSAALGGAGSAWVIVNDGVMGGRSSASVESRGDDGLRFSGELSLENNGGFSSTRRLLDQPPAGMAGVRFEARGDGREYQFRARRDRGFDDVAWRGTFSTDQDWRTVTLSFDALEPVYRGRAVPAAGRVAPERIGQIGFLLADGQAGPFELEVRRLRFFGPED